MLKWKALKRKEVAKKLKRGELSVKDITLAKSNRAQNTYLDVSRVNISDEDLEPAP
jgi:hypothetical protein